MLRSTRARSAAPDHARRPRAPADRLQLGRLAGRRTRPPRPPPRRQTATPGGTLRFALGASPSGVDPQQVGSNVSIYIARQLADSLTDQDPETGEIVPWLARELGGQRRPDAASRSTCATT